MSTSSARTSLLTTLKTITGIPTVYSEGENFTPKSMKDYPFVRFTILPNTSNRGPLTGGSTTCLSGTKKFYTGLARIDLYFTRSANSADSALALAETVVAAFLPSTVILSDSQLNIEASWFEQIRQEESAIGIPVFVRWSSYSI